MELVDLGYPKRDPLIDHCSFPRQRSERKEILEMKNITLAAIIPLTLPDGTKLYGQSNAFGFFAPAAQMVCAFLMAIQHVSQGVTDVVPMMSTLVPNTTFLPLLYDGSFTVTQSIAGYREARVMGAHAILSGRSSITTHLASLSALDELPMCSFWGTDPAFSNKARYPFLSRSIPSTAQ